VPTLPITYLFVPGDRPDRFSKAFASGADLVILDLEDAVGPANKAAARAAVGDALAADGLQACVRINGADTEWFADDSSLLQLQGVAAVMLPKAEAQGDVVAVRAAAGEGVPIIPIVETGRGLAQAAMLAACAGVERLAFGSADFQLDMGIEADGEELLFARSQLVLASRLGGCAAPIDGVTLEVNDAARVRQDSLRARRLGFGAKLCIHPAQVGPVREAFLPDAQSLAWARGVLQAVASATAGALSYEGRMVDKPVLERARAILGRAS
jgi:citrate lyase subunit beta/citryl-CoA lyase